MKTAENWITDKTNGLGFDFVDDIQPQSKNLKADGRLVDIINEILLDGINEGMTRAAKIADRMERNDGENYGIEEAILTARDNFTL